MISKNCKMMKAARRLFFCRLAGLYLLCTLAGVAGASELACHGENYFAEGGVTVYA